VRLQAPSREHPLRARMIQRFMRLRLAAVPDVILACQHRPEFFGKGFLEWVEASLRGSSHWTQGECELMAALVSDRNLCQFCIGAHSATASALVGEETVKTVLSGDLAGAGAANADARISDQLRATLAFIEKLSLSPAEIGADDVDRAVAAGVDPQALRDAVEVCAAFNVINRIADALHFEPQDEKSLSFMSKVLTIRGYRA
jgi:uncharacterized peroxidase-related enzyme